MSGKIKVLDEAVINRIAAGESVSRPAAIIKELVENAIDAQADEITIKINAGGKTLILVRDNGEGMSADDLLMCVQRHATSKITTLTDLEHACSFGFRGEALASIASVSDFSIRSGHEGQGHELLFAANRFSVRPCAYTRGTQVRVGHLFRAIPARLKFLKSDRSETLAILAMLRGLALARPDVSFHLVEGQGNTDTERVLLSVRKETPEERDRAIMGDGFFISSLILHGHEDPVSVWGRISAPKAARKAATDQFIIMNGRVIRDATILSAVRTGLAGRIPNDKHASFVMRIALPPNAVDVNAHPTKAEVRFRDPRSVFTAVEQAVFASLPRALQRNAAPKAAIAETPLATGPIIIGSWEVVMTKDGPAAMCRKEVIRKRLETAGTEDLTTPVVIQKFKAGHEDALAALGVQISSFGGGTYLLDAVPAGVPGDPAALGRRISEAKTPYEAVMDWAEAAYAGTSLFEVDRAVHIPVVEFSALMRRSA